MNSIIYSGLLLLCALYAYNCANVTLNAYNTSPVLKNFDVKCNYTLNRNEYFASLSLLKNNQVFYTYSNQTLHSKQCNIIEFLLYIMQQGELLFDTFSYRSNILQNTWNRQDH